MEKGTWLDIISGIQPLKNISSQAPLIARSPEGRITLYARNPGAVAVLTPSVSEEPDGTRKLKWMCMGEPLKLMTYSCRGQIEK